MKMLKICEGCREYDSVSKSCPKIKICSETADNYFYKPIVSEEWAKDECEDFQRNNERKRQLEESMFNIEMQQYYEILKQCPTCKQGSMNQIEVDQISAKDQCSNCGFIESYRLK